jgi:dTDP-4-dehydrorhamnose reductase
MRILVTGASGLLGLNFALQFHNQHDVTGVVHSNPLNGTPFIAHNTDLSKSGNVNRLLEAVKPEVVLHCAAMANIDACERDPEMTWKVNTDLPTELAHAAARDGFKLVHLSTDAVFDGLQGDYDEESDPNPLNTYARSKLAAERKVLAACPSALVARVNFFGWSLSGSRSLGEFFYYNLAAHMTVNGFTDVLFCPLEATILADVLLQLVERDCSGIYHVVSSQSLSKYEFGCAVAEKFGLNKDLIQPITVENSGLAATRSPNLRLRTDKLAIALGKPSPDQQAGLQRFHELFLSGYPQRVQALAGTGVKLDSESLRKI